MRFQCPFCRGIVAVENSDLGIDVQCGHCGEVVTVPYSRVATGAVIADFIILEELGRGGMGIVYLAHQISLDRPAALKVLSDTYANNAEFVVNFIKEARAAAKLNHPHIVQAYAVGEDEGVFYFAMENIDGETMKHVLKRKKIIKVDKATIIIQQIAEALDYAWKEQKLIHRDIKPDNIMLTKNDRAKLADLGLSRVAGELDDSEEDEVMGTPQYISPEHLTGAPMDVRSDIYSLGATYYHLITGKFPFEGKTATEIARKHLDAKLVPPREINKDIPEEISVIICKMMEKNVKRRYQDAEELVDDLRLARRGKTPSTATEGISKKKTKSGKTIHVRTGAKTGQFKITNTSAVSTKTGTLSGTKMSATASKSQKDLTGTISMTEPKSKMPLAILLIVVLVLTAGGFAAWKFVLTEEASTEKPEIPPAEKIVKTQPEKKPEKEKSEFDKIIDGIIEFRAQNPDKDSFFVSKCEDFFSSGPEPSDDKQKIKHSELKAEYVSTDEKLIESARNKIRDAYLKEIAKRRKLALKQAEAKRKKAEIERRHQAREQKLKAIEQEQKERLAQRIAEYKKNLENTQNYMRRRFIDYVKKDDFKSAEQVFIPALQEKDKASDNSVEEKQLAASFIEWAEKMIKAVKDTEKLSKAIYDSGKLLEGTQIEIKRGVLGKIKSINKGYVTVSLMLQNRTIKFPVKKLKGKYFITFLKRASSKISAPNAYFYYLLCNGEFYAAKRYVPDTEWKKEISKLAFEYIRLKLKYASDSEKPRLREKYGALPEYKKALREPEI